MRNLICEEQQNNGYLANLTIGAGTAWAMWAVGWPCIWPTRNFSTCPKTGVESATNIQCESKK